MNNEQTAPDAENLSDTENLETEEIQEEEAAPVAEKDSEESKRLRGVERRINRLARERSEARAEADYYKQALQSQTPQNDEPVTQVDLDAKFEQWQAQQNGKQRAERITGQIEKAINADPDFAEALENSNVVYSNDQLEIIQDTVDSSDVGIDLIRYLAKNPDEQERLSGLSVVALARELGRLENKVTAALRPKPSNAPKPLDSVRANASPSAPSESDTSKWIAWRNESQRRK